MFFSAIKKGLPHRPINFVGASSASLNAPNKSHAAWRILLISVLVFINGCQLQPQQTTPAKKVIVDDLQYESRAKQDKAINDAINFLLNGKNTKAEVLIAQVLRFNAKHKTALLLNQQLRVRAAKLFSTSRTTTYIVKQGDSLGSISKKWLTNSLYFVSLAKLNNIDNPSKIEPGTKLVIPVIKSSPLVKQERRRSRANVELLSKYVSQKKIVRSLNRMTTIFMIGNHQQELLQLQHDALNLLAASRVSISERHRMVDQVKAVLSKSTRKFLNPNLQQFIKLQLHDLLLDEFLLLYEDKSYLEAAEKIVQAIELKPIIKQNVQILKTQKKLVNKLHEKAVILRKNQQLKEAIAIWKLILKLQPQNVLALKYYERTRKLLTRLNKLQ